VPLWVYFLAVQFMDVVWAILVLLGIEKVKISPGLMQGSALDLYYMPYTHGLFGALALSVMFGAVAALFFRARRGAVFAACTLAVFSHWICDLLVHRPDLWIYDDVKMGLGLWRWIWISLPLELIVLALGAWLYARFVPARRGGNLWLWGFVLLMAAVELYGAFGPPPATPRAEAETALLAYGALAVLAALVDFSRVPRLRMPAAA